MEKVLFVNYISNKTPLEKKKTYNKQHSLLVTTILYKQPNGIASLINGETGDTRFIEALSKLREIKKDYNHPVMYLDNDCVLIDRVDSLFDNFDFDVAIPYRYHWKAYGGHQDCLGGFLYFSGKRPKTEDRFLKNLIECTKKWYEIDNDHWYYDQLAVNDLIGRPPTERTRKEYFFAESYEPCLKKVNGVKVLFVSANEWACPMSMIFAKDVKIIHYNHKLSIRYVKLSKPVCGEEDTAQVAE